METRGSSAREMLANPLDVTRSWSARTRASTRSSVKRCANRSVSMCVSSLKIASFTSAVDAGGEEPSVNHEALTSDEAGGVGGQQHGGARDLRHVSEPLHRGAQQQLATSFGLVEQLPIQVRP